jgi:3',5'-cyclic AMP phosphodiesterase CpdA
MRIVLVSDTHLAPTAGAFNDNWRAVRAFVAASRADLTIHLGDVTVDGPKHPEQFAHVQAISAGWPTPIRYLPGNHDIGDSPPGPGLPSQEPLRTDRLEDFRRVFGPDYWMVEAEGWRLIGLNAQLFGTDTAEETAQWSWLEAQLARSHGRSSLVLLHKPLFQTSPTDEEPKRRYVPVAPRRRLYELLAHEDLRAVISGHVHQYLDRRIDGVRYVWVPSAAYFMPDEVQDRIGEKITGVGVLELARDGLQFHLVCPEGVLRHSSFDHPVYPKMVEAARAYRAAAARPVGQLTPVPPSPQ